VVVFKALARSAVDALTFVTPPKPRGALLLDRSPRSRRALHGSDRHAPVASLQSDLEIDRVSLRHRLDNSLRADVFDVFEDTVHFILARSAKRR